MAEKVKNRRFLLSILDFSHFHFNMPKLAAIYICMQNLSSLAWCLCHYTTAIDKNRRFLKMPLKPPILKCIHFDTGLSNLDIYSTCMQNLTFLAWSVWEDSPCYKKSPILVKMSCKSPIFKITVSTYFYKYFIFCMQNSNQGIK